MYGCRHNQAMGSLLSLLIFPLPHTALKPGTATRGHASTLAFIVSGAGFLEQEVEDAMRLICSVLDLCVELTPGQAQCCPLFFAGNFLDTLAPSCSCLVYIDCSREWGGVVHFF